MLRKSPVIVLLLLFSLLVAACGGGATTEAPPAATEAPAAETEATEPPVAAQPSDPTAETEAEAEALQSQFFSEVPEVRTDLAGQSIAVVLGADGPSNQWEDEAAAVFSELSGIEVQVIRGDQSATDRLATYLQQLSAGSADVDVYMIDVIWPGIMAEFAHDLGPAMEGEIDQFFPAIVENNTVEGRLVGVPWYTDAGLLYYRTDLLEKYGFDGPPTTWAELEEMSNTIQEGERAEGNPDFWGYVWQGNAYEGLTCDALEWQVSFGGGTIVEPDGTISVNNPQTVAALEMARGWVGTISPEGVTTYQEEESRGVWQAGNAAFMRNWPYAYALGQAEDSPIAGQFDVTVLPQGEGPDARNAATLGGWQLMVSDFSDSKEAAEEFVKFLTSPEIMESHAVYFSRLPTRPALYEDPEVLEANEFFGRLLPVFSGGAVARPSTVSADLYNDVSIAYFTNVNQVLTGALDAQTAVEQIEAELQDLLQ